MFLKKKDKINKVLLHFCTTDLYWFYFRRLRRNCVSVTLKSQFLPDFIMVSENKIIFNVLIAVNKLTYNILSRFNIRLHFWNDSSISRAFKCFCLVQVLPEITQKVNFTGCNRFNAMMFSLELSAVLQYLLLLLLLLI